MTSLLPGLSPAAMRSVCPGVERQRLPAFERAGPDLRAAQVLHHRHGAAGRRGGIADGRIVPGVRLVRSVREVQPEDIDAGE